jgi:hypothetical protein
MKCTKQSVIGVHPCSFTGNEIYKTKLPLFASKEKYVGKKHYLFQHKDFERSKKLSQFTFNGQNFFFLANTLLRQALMHTWVQQSVGAFKFKQCVNFNAFGFF